MTDRIRFHSFSREIGVKNRNLSSSSRSESEIEMVRDQEREVKCVKKFSIFLEKRDCRWGLSFLMNSHLRVDEQRINFF